MRDVIVVILMLFGVFFFVLGTIGILRFPDALTRAHGAAKCDTLGAALCLCGLMVYSGFNSATLKLFITVIFIWITNPTATHAIAKGIISLQNSSHGEVRNP